jgi:hypothetical protein
MDNQTVPCQDEFSKQFTDNPELQFRDISAEYWRAYYFPDGSFVTIDDPVALSLNCEGAYPAWGGGSHRVIDNLGVAHYIPRGWIELKWQNREDCKPISF